MASTYSTNLAIELIGTGEQAGTWGVTTNTNLGTLIEQAISGYVTQAVVTGTDTTITIPNGATGVARNMFIELTGTGGALTNLIVPANKKLYFIYNNASGAVTVKVSGQTGVSVGVGEKKILVSNGTDIVEATSYLTSGAASATITNLSVTSANITTLTSSSGTVTNLLATTASFGSASISNADILSATITSATITGAGITSAAITTLTGTTVSYGSGSLTGLNVASAQITKFTAGSSAISNLFASGAITTVGNISTSGNLSASGSITASSGSITQLTSTSATITTLKATSATIDNVSITSYTVTAATITSANITTLTGTTLGYASASVTTLTGTTIGAALSSTIRGISGAITTLTGTSADITTITGVTIGNTTSSTIRGASGNIAQLTATSMSVTTLTGTSATVTTIASTSATITGLSSTSANIATLTGTTLGYASASITTITGTTIGTTASATIRGVSGSIGQFAATSATITTLSGTTVGYASASLSGANIVSAVITSATITGAGITSAAITTLSNTTLNSGSASITVLTGGNLTFTSGTITNLNTTSFTVASTTFASANITNLLGTTLNYTSGSIDIFFATNATITSATITNLSATSLNIGNTSFTSATITNLNSSSAVITLLTGTSADITTITGVTIGNTTSAHIKGISATLTTLTSTSATITTLTGTTVGYGSASLTNMKAVSAVITSATITGLGVTSAAITTLTGTTLGYASASITTVTGATIGTTASATIRGVSGVIAQFNATSATITTLTSTSATITGLSTTSAAIAKFTAGSSAVSNFLASGTITALGNISTSGNLSASGSITASSGSITNLSVTSAVITSMTITGLGVTSANITTLTGTTLGYASASITNINIATSATIGRFNAGSSAVSNLFASGNIAVSGNVGIGTTSPQSKLNVVANSSSTIIGGSTAVLQVGNSNGAALNVSAGIELFGSGAPSSGLNNRSAGLYGVYEAFNAGGNAGALVLATNPAGTTSVVERMRITSAGNVGIGTAAPTDFGGTNLAIHSSSSSAYASNLWVSGAYTMEVLVNEASGVMSIGARSNHKLDLCTNDTTRVTISNTGEVGIGGTADANAKVQVKGTLPTSSNSSIGFIASGTSPSGSTSAAYGFYSSYSTAAASFTLTDQLHFYANPVAKGAGSTIGNQYGFFASSGLTEATNNFGFYSAIASGSNRWNFYAAGTADNYFAGNVGIGVTPTVNLDVRNGAGNCTISAQYGTGTKAQLIAAANEMQLKAFNGTNDVITFVTGASERMRIDSSGNVGIGGTADASAKVNVLGTLPTSGTNTNVFWAAGTVPSGTTGDVNIFRSNPSTAAASFTVSNLIHFWANQGTIGAGSTVTNQYGFLAPSGLTGATNNYGFYSNIASGSNRWNFYAAGTAQNYFAGNVLIGTTADLGSGARVNIESADGEADVLSMRYTAAVAGKHWRFYIDSNSTFYLANQDNVGVYITDGGNSWNSLSDERLKTDLTPIEDSLNKVCQLRSVTGRFKTDEEGTSRSFLIAQDVLAVLPEAVDARDPEKLGVAYTDVIPLLVAAIKELSAKVAALEAK